MIEFYKRNVNIINILLILIVVVIFFYDTINIYFISDDFHKIKNSINVKDIILPFVEESGVYYRPIVDFSFRLDSILWKLNPIGYHITNILFHIFNCFLIYYLVKLIYQKSTSIPLLSALFFAVFPNHSTSVIWISGRTDIICCFFYLISILTFFVYLGKNKKIFLYISLSSTIFSLLSKEMAFTIPLLLLVWGTIIYSSEFKSVKATFVYILKKLIPYFILFFFPKNQPI